MSNILVVAAHSAQQNSVANATLLADLRNALPQVQVRQLDETNFTFDLAAEQEAVKQADVLVLQFPLHWYSTPAILKKWMDDVLAYGFAYGTGAVLGGKKLVVSYTAAAPEACYQAGEMCFIDREDIVNVFRATAKMCGMEFAGSIVGEGYTPAFDEATRTANTTKAHAQAERLVELLRSL